MAKKGKLSLEELLEQALVKDKPYEVLGNWVWTRLGTVCRLENGYAFKSDDYKKLGVPLVRISNINGYSADISKCVYIDRTDIDKKFLINHGDLLIAMSGATTGKMGIYKYQIPAWQNQRIGNLKVLHEKIFSDKYRNYYMMNQQKAILDKAYGGAQPNISGKMIEDFYCPIPPLPEQQRIVTIIESLFEKLDRAKELAQNALDSFENRKSAILHKAFTGELTRKWREENPQTESAEQLFNIIMNNRLELEDSTAVKKMIVEEINKVNIPMELPKGWLILKTMLFCHNITCGNTPKEFIANDEEIPFLKVYNIVNNEVAFQYKPQFIPREIHDGKLKSSKLLSGDVIMNIVGPPLRKIAIIPEYYKEWSMNQAIVRFRPIKDVLSKYIYYCLLNKETLNEVINETRGVVGQSNISVTQSRNLLMVIPPLKEQHQIVRILDHLLVNEQKAKELCSVIDKIDHIKKSILAKAFRGELGTNHPEEESALELLKEVLQEKSK